MGESKSRGELAEIRTTLAALASSGGSSKAETTVTAKRDVFKKIINYITIGIDMSSLFMQVEAHTLAQQRVPSCSTKKLRLVHCFRGGSLLSCVGEHVMSASIHGASLW